MAPRLSGQTSIFGVVFFVSKPLLGIKRQKQLKKITILTQKPQSHVRKIIYTSNVAYCEFRLHVACETSCYHLGAVPGHVQWRMSKKGR